MAYVINKTSGLLLTVLEDGTVDTSTSVGLVGRNYTGYGEIQNENFLGLLENWANTNPPSRPISGQTWFNTFNKTLNVYEGDKWVPVGSTVIQNTSPEGIAGTLWFKGSTKQLFVYNENAWNLVGPEGLEGFGETRSISTFLLDSTGAQRPIILNVVDDKVISITASSAYLIRANEQTHITNKYNLGYTDSVLRTISSGVNLNTFPSFDNNFIGPVEGNAASATRLETPRFINGIAFDGQNDITITSSTTGTLNRGGYLTGSNFNGLNTVTWAVDASSSNLIGKVVARDSAGDFAAGTITANLVGNVTGNVTTAEGISSFNVVQANEFVGAQLSGNAFTATRLKTPRTINGVEFDGSADITVTAAADTLTGTQLAANIVQLGTLNQLNVADTGVSIGNSGQLDIFIDVSIPTIKDTSSQGIAFNIIDNNLGDVDFKLINSSLSLSLGGANAPAFIPENDDVTNLGILTKRWNTVHANLFQGTATAARYADLAENYLADAKYEPGTVLEFGGSQEVTVAEDETRRVAGVVSSNPAYLMNSELQGDYVVALALQGRVPCKVRGKIRKGDMLVSGGNGYARPTIDPKIGTIIGKALEDFEGTDGIIEIVVGRV